MKHLNVRRALWVSLVALLPCVAKAQEESSEITLSLEQAIEIGMSESPTIKVAELEVERVDYSRKQARAGLFPIIAASADYSRTLKKQVMYMDGFSLGGGATDPAVELMKSIHATDASAMQIIKQYEDAAAAAAAEAAAKADEGITMGRDNTWSAGFSAQLPIIAPQLWKNISMTETDVKTAIEKSRSSKLSLVNSIEKSFYNWILAQDSYKVLEMSYNNAKINAENYRNLYDQGLASEYDLLRSEVQVRSQEPALLQAENGIALAALQLKVLIGLDANVNINTETTLDSYESEMYNDALNVDTSLSNNTTLRQLDLQTTYLEQALSLQKRAYYPTLSATGMYTWISMNNDFKFQDYRWSPYSTVGLKLSWTLFQGGSRRYQVQQSKIGIKQMGYQREDVEKSLSMQVEAAMNNINKAIKQVASNKVGVEQAEKAMTIMEKSFEIGSSTFIELNDANLALTNSRLAYNQAIYDYLTAMSELDLVLGNKNVDNYSKEDK